MTNQQELSGSGHSRHFAESDASEAERKEPTDISLSADADGESDEVANWPDESLEEGTSDGPVDRAAFRERLRAKRIINTVDWDDPDFDPADLFDDEQDSDSFDVEA